MGRRLIHDGPNSSRKCRELILAGYTDEELYESGFDYGTVVRSITTIIAPEPKQRCKYCGTKAVYIDDYGMCMACRLRRKK